MRNPESQIKIRLKQYLNKTIALILIQVDCVPEVAIIRVEFERFSNAHLERLIQAINVVLVCGFHSSNERFRSDGPPDSQSGGGENLSCAPDSDSPMCQLWHLQCLRNEEWLVGRKGNVHVGDVFDDDHFGEILE